LLSPAFLEIRRLRVLSEALSSGTPRALAEWFCSRPAKSRCREARRAAFATGRAHLAVCGKRTGCATSVAVGLAAPDLTGGAAVLAVVLMVGWLALSNIFGRYK
jgi:hypothetical protein